MSETTKIQWCDATLNLWWGCTKVSEGCKNCYAENLSDQRYGKGCWGPKGKRTEIKSWRSILNKIAKSALYLIECKSCGRRGESRTWDEDLKKDNPNAVQCCQDPNLVGARPRVFCSSMCDVFEGPETMGGVDSENWKLVSQLRRRLWDAIHEHVELDFLLLTKRPQNIQFCVTGLSENHSVGFPDNVWIGTSVENQETADERIPELLKIPAAVRFLSCEPLLGPVDLAYACFNGADSFGQFGPKGSNDIQWVICGGESGPNARPMRMEWPQSLRDQCVAAGVPFFFKQWGEWLPWMYFNEAGIDDNMEASRYQATWQTENDTWDHGYTIWSDELPNHTLGKVGKHRAGRLLDGREWNEFPVVKEVVHG